MPLFRKIIIIFAVVVLILFIALVIAAWYLGTFATVELKHEYRGPYYLVMLSRIGSYHEIARTIEQVDIMLEEKGIRHAHAVAIFYDDPTRVPLQQLHIRAGFSIPDSVKVDSPLIFERIDKRLVAVASIQAHSAIAPFKTYPALQEWMQQNGYISIRDKPTLELYYVNGLVEVEIPFMSN